MKIAYALFCGSESMCSACAAVAQRVGEVLRVHNKTARKMRVKGGGEGCRKGGEGVGHG